MTAKIKEKKEKEKKPDSELVQKYREFVSWAAPNTQKNYLFYIQNLPWTSLDSLKGVNDDEIMVILNKSIAGCGKCSRVMMRSAFLQLLVMINRESLKPKLTRTHRVARAVKKKFLTFGEIKAIVDATDDLQMKLLIMCQYDACCRISALLSAKIEDIVYDDSNTPKQLCIVETKTEDNRTVTLSPHTSILLKEYLGTKKNGLLFEIPYITLYKHQKILFRKVLKKNTVSSHWFRGSRAVHLFQSGYDIDTIRMYGGWSSSAVLEYLKMSGIDQARVMRENTPQW